MTEEKTKQPKKKWYKTWWGIGGIILGFFILVGIVGSGDLEENQGSKTQTDQQKEEVAEVVQPTEDQKVEEEDQKSQPEEIETQPIVLGGTETNETDREQVEVSQEILYKVVEVVDGDTIKVEINGETKSLRLIGIDTPEKNHPSKPVECFSQEASDKTTELVNGKEVKLEKDVSETDKYGRLLRYIYVGDIFINDYLVRQGYAQASSYPPDVKYQDQLTGAEREARENNRGLWGNVCACERGKEINRECIGCNLVRVTKTNWNCSTYTEEITDTSCTGGCQVALEPKPTPTPPPPSPSYTCDCSKTCSQMSSCEEAYYQLNTCGCSVRDGDNDGVPCESLCPGG